MSGAPGEPARATPAPPPAIELADATVVLGSRVVLERVSLVIPRGERVSVVGPNGGGKTTFLRLCLGLVAPERGAVRVLGAPPSRRRNRVGYVPQSLAFDPDYPVTALDVVLMGRLGGRRRGPFVRAADRAEAHRALRQVGLDELAPAPFAELSGGQRQRVIIARALATQPEILLLDEPTANVDPGTEHELYQLLAGLGPELTVVTATHDMNFVHETTERVVCVNRTVAVHPTGEVPPDMGFELSRSQRRVRHDQDVSLDGGR